MNQGGCGEALPVGGIGETSSPQRWASAPLQKPLLALLQQALRCLDATGSFADAGPDGEPGGGSSTAGLPVLLARTSSVLTVLGRVTPSWQEMEPAQIARFLLTLQLQLEDGLEVSPVSSATLVGQQTGYCALTLRQATRRLRSICAERLGVVLDPLESLAQQPTNDRRASVLSRIAEAVGRVRLLNAVAPAAFESGSAGARTRFLSQLTAIMVRRELTGLRFADSVDGQDPVEPVLARLLQQLRGSLQDGWAGSVTHDQLVKDCGIYSAQRRVLLQDRLVPAGRGSELFHCFLEELTAGLGRLRVEWSALSATQGLRYLSGWHCAWVSRLTTAALISGDVPRHNLLEAWRILLWWQFERSEPLRQPDLALFEEVCAALAPGSPETGMAADADGLEARLAIALCAREVSTEGVSGQVPVYLAQNIRALLTVCADIRACTDQTGSAVADGRLLVELRLLAAGARVLGVYRVEALSSALAEVHLMLARAGHKVLEPGRLDLLAEAHRLLCSCLNCAAAHQEVPDCRELIATLYGWLDSGITGLAHRSQDDLTQPAGIVCADEKSLADCFQREAVGLVEAIDRGIAALVGSAVAAPDLPSCPQLLSLLHTLKGSALQFDCTAIADLCHGLEQLLLRKPASDAAGGSRQVDSASAAVLAYADRLREAIDDLGRRQAVDSGAPVALPAGDDPSLPVAAQAMTRIAGLAEQIGHCSRAMLDLLPAIGTPDDSASRMSLLRDLLAEQQRYAVQLAEEIAGSRTVCFDRLSARLQRLAARHANQLDRQVWFQVQGGEVQMDRLLLERLVAPLEHLLRNAIDHGIEPVGERRAASKPDCGSITLRVAADDGQRPQLRIELSDDGRGIEPGNSDPGVAEEERMQRLFAVGFSTRARVTTQGGHGLGLAAVKGAVAALKGSIRVSSRPGAGTCFHIALPV